MYIAILGNHQAISLAELERTYANVTTHGAHGACFDGELSAHLGGTSKIGEIISTIETTDEQSISDYIADQLSTDIDWPEHKFSFGVSMYGRRVKSYRKTLFDLKKRLRSQGLKPRLIIGDKQHLNSAQVLHNGLADSGIEILVVVGEHSTLIARNVWVQDIDAYSLRDMQRPVRDMHIGMLPPKLAQIMLNLAGGQHIFDPYCGTGVVLQEALLMGKRAGGSDLSERMVEATCQNLSWLNSHFESDAPDSVFQADARTLQLPPGIDAIVTEGYLGPIQHGHTGEEQLQQLAEESLQLMHATLKNLASQLKPGTPLCLALPAWSHQNETIIPPLVDTVESLGYNQVRLKSVPMSHLLYRRESQHVGRQLILLEKQ